MKKNKSKLRPEQKEIKPNQNYFGSTYKERVDVLISFEKSEWLEGKKNASENSITFTKLINQLLKKLNDENNK